MKHVGVVAAGGFALLAFAPAVARAQTVREVSRSSPFIATVDLVESHYQGSYEVVTPEPPVPTFNGAADAATFEFPYTLGHLRAVRSTDIPAIETRFQDLIAIFDAADNLQTMVTAPNGCAQHFTATCRTVFTTVASPDAAGLAQRPARVFLNTTNLAALKPLLAPSLTDPEVTLLIGRLLSGVSDGAGNFNPGLGGIDRSTLAIVDPSPFVPEIAGEPRATMIYVGALDGMVHAICAEVRGPCQQEGQELWAFIPRTQLGQLRFNTQRIDGSVKVADVFDDFNLTDSVVSREFRTVLTFQTGSGDPAATNLEPSVLAIDVSNPADPIVLWERSTPSSVATVVQGVGLNLAMGTVRMAGELRNLTFAQTNNGAGVDAGFYLAAIDTSTGAEAWSYPHLYPAPRNVVNPPVPDSGIPGGVAAFDADQSGLATHIAFTSLYGDIWVMEADGDRPYADDPIFRFSTDFQPIGAPPTIYFDQSNGRFYAVAVSGGYADPVAATWVQPTDNHFVVSVAVDPQLTNVPMDEVTTGYGDDRGLVITLDPGQRATAQVVVAGNELFVTTDSTDANLATYGDTPGTGTLARYSLSTGALAGTAIGIAGGASAVDVSQTGVVSVGSGAGAMQVDVNTTGGGGIFDAAGVIIERTGEQNNRRLLWMNG